MTHNFNSLVKFGLGLFMAGSASLMLVGCDKAPSGNSSSASQDHLARIKSAGELKVGLGEDWQPFSFHDEKDKLVGYDVEVAQNLAKKLGVKAKIHYRSHCRTLDSQNRRRSLGRSVCRHGFRKI